MTKSSEQKVSILGSLMRKQEWDIAELQSGLARARELVEKLSDAARTCEANIATAEAGLRFGGEGASLLSVDSLQRHRRFLAQQHKELVKVLREHQRAEAVAQEFVKKLTELRVKMRVYENLANRMRTALAAEEEKAEMKELDDLWLMRTG